MAVFKVQEYLVHSNDAAFDGNYNPGVSAPYAGIYRCMGCHREIGIADSHVLPPQWHQARTKMSRGESAIQRR